MGLGLGAGATLGEGLGPEQRQEEEISSSGGFPLDQLGANGTPAGPDKTPYSASALAEEILLRATKEWRDGQADGQADGKMDGTAAVGADGP